MFAITEVRIKLAEPNCNRERLLAYCTIIFDGCFVIHDLKLIEGKHGKFIAMPSRRLQDRCDKCRVKNYLLARYCQSCGHKLAENRYQRSPDGYAILYDDVAHPITRETRENIQVAIFAAYNVEREKAKQPGYAYTYADRDDVDDLISLYPRST